MPNKPNKYRLPVGTLALVVLLLILSACQPTPEKEPVVVKTEDYVAEAIQPKDGTHDKYRRIAEEEQTIDLLLLFLWHINNPQRFLLRQLAIQTGVSGPGGSLQPLIVFKQRQIFF